MVVILAGLLLFAIIHTLTADKAIKTYFMSRFGERIYHGWYRLIYNALSLLTITPIILYTITQGNIIWTYPDAVNLLLLGVQLVGVIGLLASIAQIDGGQFLGIAQWRAYRNQETLPLPPEPLQTRGVYALVRHPLYFFSLLVLWGISPMTDTMLAFNLGVTLYFIIGSRYEERRMLAIFGESYRTYQQDVPWLIPLSNWCTTRTNLE